MPVTYGEWRFTRRGWVREKIVPTVEVRPPTKAPRGWRLSRHCVRLSTKHDPGAEGFSRKTGDVAAYIWTDNAGAAWHWSVFWDSPEYEDDEETIASGDGSLRRCIAAAERSLAKHKGKHSPPTEDDDDDDLAAPAAP